jgi:hypothetical protein
VLKFKNKFGSLRVKGLSPSTTDTQIFVLILKPFVSAEATNLFLRENGHEVLKAMMPQLQHKLSEVFKGIANQLLTHVSTDILLLPAKA